MMRPKSGSCQVAEYNTNEIKNTLHSSARVCDI